MIAVLPEAAPSSGRISLSRLIKASPGPPSISESSGISFSLSVFIVRIDNRLTTASATPVRSELRERDGESKIYRGLRRDQRVLPVDHPLARNEEAHGRQARLNQRAAESNT